MTLTPAQKTPEALTVAARSARQEEHARELALAETKFELATFIKSAAGLFAKKDEFAAWLAGLGLNEDSARAYLKFYKNQPVLQERLRDELAGQVFLFDLPRAEPRPKPSAPIDQAAALGEVDGLDFELVASTSAIVDQVFKQATAQHRADAKLLSALALKAVNNLPITADDIRHFNAVRARLAA